jgi:hypothetical protein
MLFIMNFLSLDQFKPRFKLLEIESTNDMAATRGSHGRRPHWISGAAQDLGHGLAGGQVDRVERPKAVAQATGTQRRPRQNGFSSCRSGWEVAQKGEVVTWCTVRVSTTGGTHRNVVHDERWPSSQVRRGVTSSREMTSCSFRCCASSTGPCCNSKSREERRRQSRLCCRW